MESDPGNAIEIHLPPFSTISPYLVPDREVSRQEHPFYNRRYLKSLTPEPLSEQMAFLLRGELQNMFYEVTALSLRAVEPCRLGWRRMGRMTTFNQRRLPRRAFARRGDVIEYLNKEIMVYFETKGLSTDIRDDRIGRYIYRLWLRLHGGRPRFQRQSFFAKAICFGEQDPGIFQICHHSTRAFVTHGAPAALFCPMPGEKIQSWRDHKFTAPLDMEMRYQLQLSQCEVLLVKMGDESHLDSRISFQPLFDAGLALDVNRQDHESNTEETVVRVKIDVAVHFVWDKLCKERNALANLGQAAQELEEEQRGLCEAWTNRVMIHAEEIGIDVNEFTWQAARRALARLDGEAFDEEHVSPWHESLRNWEG
ncbi:hypothetical protein BKA56DRAFT_628958 [Ilyonectria sp. MPI-CAGE-AT-0026]|nr:hypothetical protein BKA56DRAFT_628958 [Ilyonectria sp. MPI-CAGE-AT-0026]